MKKKLLFLGLLIGIFTVLMVLPASAVELPAADTGCEYCRPTWDVVGDSPTLLHCDGLCRCEWVRCPTCGNNTVLVFCGKIHAFDQNDGHSYGNGYKFFCEYCDFFNTTLNAFATHKTCSKTVVTVEPTCLSVGYESFRCNKPDNCPHGGERRNSLSYTAATLAHTFEYVKTVEVACGSYSGDLYECSGCGFQKIENPVANPHTPIDSGTVTPATCTTAGYTTHTCSTCSETYTVDEVPATSHTYTSTVTTPATCSATGVMTYTCSGCSHSYTESIAKTDHSYQSTVAAPTCTATGYTTYTCSVCSHTYTGNTVAATGHKNTTKVNTAATCTGTGSQTTTCSVCGYSSTASIPATGHSYKGTTVVPDCTEGGYTRYVCSTCSDTYIGDQIPAAGHRYQHLITEPSCEVGGFTKHICTVCKDSYTDALTLPTGHIYSATVTAPTCTVRGYTTHACTQCAKSYRDSYVDALGHSEEPYGLDFRCTVCGNVRTVTTGIRALNSIVNGLKLSGTGFASGMVDLFDGLIEDDGELTTVATAAFSLAGFALIGVIAFALFYKFNRRM